MAYDEYLTDRIRQQLNDKRTPFEELKMMEGLCFKVDNKILCGIYIDKIYGYSLLMARIGEDASKAKNKKLMSVRLILVMLILG